MEKEKVNINGLQPMFLPFFYRCEKKKLSFVNMPSTKISTKTIISVKAKVTMTLLWGQKWKF